MLNKKEVSVMQTIYNVCAKNNDSAIITEEYIIGNTPEKFKLDAVKLDAILKQLEYDGYFECTKSDKNGATVNVITLNRKGKAFKREMLQRRRELINQLVWRIIFAAVGAVAALAVNSIFSK